MQLRVDFTGSGEQSMSDNGKPADRAEQAKDQPQEKQGEALRNEALSASFGPRVRVVGERAELLDTAKAGTPEGKLVGPTKPDAPMSVTIMVKSKASEKDVDETLAKIIKHEQAPLTDAEFQNKFGADPDAVKRIVQFAKDNHLKAERIDDRSGQVVLKGKVADFARAFNVKIEDYQNGNNVNRERSGLISVPRNIAGDVQGVFGLDSRPQAESHVKLLPPGISPRAVSGYMPDEVANQYKFPKDSMGAGQSVGIVEFGGGLDLKDNSQYYKDHGLKEPKVQIVTIGDAKNKPGGSADSEVALDSQVIGVIAPEATQQLIFAPNSEQGFLDAITRATFPEKGEIQNSAISISWGMPESSWSEQALQNMNAAFKKAALKGISVFAAAGDDGAKDKSSDGKFTADYPAADPWVTGAGGTNLNIGADKEVTWNDGNGPFSGSTGGGLSRVFPVPDFQGGIKLPADANNDGKTGRGVPDIAGNASPFTGYRVRYRGSETVMGGTSAVAPLYAALTMRLNGALGRPVGHWNAFLYKNGGTDMFRDITDGNNNGYSAGPGWDAATGWGSVRGDKMLEALKKQQR